MPRRFPDRVNETLGVCLKRGPAHEVRAFGRRLQYPADAVCVRPAGCVWSTAETGLVGFLSLDIQPTILAHAAFTGPMGFSSRSSLPDLVAVAAALRSSAHPLVKETALTELVNALLDARLIATRELEPAASHRTVKRARELLIEELNTPPSLTELARELGCNHFVLLRAFRREMGVPPHAFVLRVRIERARQLLARGNEVTEVAHALGFADQSHFTRHFKRVVGLAPGAYQRHVRSIG